MIEIMRRIKRTRYLVTTFLIFAVTIYVFLNRKNWAWYNRPMNNICETPQVEMKDLISLAHDTRDALQSANLTYFLVYGR